MDMSMSKAAQPWLDQPVWLHSSRADTCKLIAAQCQYRNGFWRYWYQADWVYGYATIIFMLGVISLFVAGNVASIISRHKRASSSKNAFWKKTTATCRFLSSKSFHVKTMGWYSPTLGVMIIGTLGGVYFLALTLGPQPYYWPNTSTLSYGGSPPIATRAGWMAVALLPFAMAFASKANLITALTGVSHEKLQVFHRFTSWAMFVLALVHTFPFIILHIVKGDMMTLWTTSVVYWTGVAALIPQAWLTIMSIGPLRKRYYEFFKSTHYLAIIFFLFFFFIHCDFRLTSWDYFIACAVICLPSLLYPWIRTLISSSKTYANLSISAEGNLHIKIPTSISWTAGQHVFLRFLSPQLGLHNLSTHPFTISSLPSATSTSANEMTFFVQPHRGITARLVSLAYTTPRIRVLVEGPYGGTATSNFERFDNIILIGGGSGGTFLLPILERVLRAQSSGEETKHMAINVIMAVRKDESVQWFSEAVQSILTRYNADGVKVDLYTSSSTTAVSSCLDVESSTDSISGDDIEKKSTHISSLPVANIKVKVHPVGRPNVGATIKEISAVAGKTVAIAACGPASMLLDVGNEVAACQMRILGGSNGATEVYLHSEGFSW